MSNEKYAQCEKAYFEYVNSVRKGNGVVYYENINFQLLFDYNQAMLDVSFNEERLRELVQADLRKQREEGKLHVKYMVDLNKKAPKSVHDLLIEEGFDYYEYIWMKKNYTGSQLEVPNHVSVQKTDDFIMLEGALNLNYADDVQIDEEMANQRGKMFEHLFSKENMLFYQLVLDGKVVGFGTAFLYNNIAKLEDLLIDEAERGKGLGKVLVSEMIRLIQEEKGIHDFYLNAFNEKEMIHFYSRLGFEKIGLNDNYLWMKELI